MADTKNSAKLKPFDASEWHVGLVVGLFNTKHTKQMKELALKTLTSQYKVKKENVYVIEVAGAADMPAPLEHLARNDLVKCIVTLGVIIKGETDHNEYVGQIVIEAVKEVAIKHAKPISFGIITADTEEQVKARGPLAPSYVDAAMHSAKALRES